MSGKGDLIRVSATSRPALVAGSIAKAVRMWRAVDIQAIGAPAVHQAVKAIAIAVGFLRQDGIAIAFVPEFSIGDVGGEFRTAIKFVVTITPPPDG